MGCESECVNIHRIESLENDFRDLKKKISQEHEKFYSRIEELERRMDVVSKDLQHIRDAVDEVNNNVKSLMSVPSKRYESAITGIIGAVIGAVVAYFLKGGTFPG